MNGRSRTIAAVLAIALAAMLPVSCACAPAPSARSGHECCAPVTALSADEHDCCGGSSGETEALAPVAAPDLAASLPSSVVAIAPPRLARASATRPTTLAPPPPPLILRI